MGDTNAERPSGGTDADEPPLNERRAQAPIAFYARLIKQIVARVAGGSRWSLREDIEQQVFIGIWGQLQREQNIAHPASYIYRAAVRETVRALRRQHARAEEPLEEDTAEAIDRQDPEASIAQGELAELIERCLGRLAGDRQRAVRAHLLGFDVDEIMRIYEWPYHKARNLIARGMAELRGLLKEQGIQWG